MGDPDFDLGVEERDSILRKMGLSSRAREDVGSRSPRMSGFHFSRLPHTKEEVETIGDLLGEQRAVVYTGKEALEEVLRLGGPPRILHLATHGFFLEDLPLGGPNLGVGRRGLKEIQVEQADDETGRILNPLLRSGVVLAGANRALRSGNSKEHEGIVTAEEILGLNLHKTNMVVLSACETGIGDVQMGQGVFGLRRSFAQAGTKSMVMSMWSVPDRETTELMVAFYENLVSGELSRCQALRRAALREMEIVRERYGHANPFFWGAFIFLGEP
jgi:CHAT domain-containing protein